MKRNDVLHTLNARPGWLGRTSKQGEIVRIRWFLFSLLTVICLSLLIWIVQIFVANRIAQRDFATTPCWFVQEDRPQNLPGLAPGPKGFYIPNPLRQLNRRFVGLYLDETSVYAPHFAVAALDADGRPALWGWSYRKMDFWSLTEKSQSRRTGPLATFISEKDIRAACPDLKQPVQADRIRSARGN